MPVQRSSLRRNHAVPHGILLVGTKAPNRAGTEDYLLELWSAFRGHNLLLQEIEFIVLLPWVCASWLWNMGWLLWVRILLVLGLAWVNLYMFWPWKDR